MRWHQAPAVGLSGAAQVLRLSGGDNGPTRTLYNHFCHADTTTVSRRNNICFFAL